MQTWFSCKVKYQKIDDHGKMSRASENYLVDAINFTEAEKRIFEIMEQYVSGDLEVVGISRTNFTEIFNYDDGQYWYKAKVGWSIFDENSSKETKVNNQMLVAANSVRDAYDRISENMETMLVPVEITAVALSPILDVFPLFDSEETDDDKVENTQEQK
ncbi:MAG: DUF4494 domain-containing protein [Bacteroidales bacterium]|nr:DUF4494 domain-containing protein [Bacteroidales bacterium]